MSGSASVWSLRRFELASLYQQCASWSAPVKALLGVVFACLIWGLGETFCLKAARERLVDQEAHEGVLRQQFVDKAGRATNLEASTRQVQALRAIFAQQLRQLPGETEVPGLLEDITRLGLASGLLFEEVKLLPEVARPLYVELPIQVVVTGAYHDLAVFVSGMGGLARIVTLHDFSLQSVAAQAGLRLELLARTYRYNPQEPGL